MPPRKKRNTKSIADENVVDDSDGEHDGEHDQGGGSVSGSRKRSRTTADISSSIDTSVGTWTGRGEGSGLLVLSTPQLAKNGSKKIFCFDLDDTLIKSKSNTRFSKDPNDWQFFDPLVPRKLQEAVADGAKIVVMTNQSGIDGFGYSKAKENVFCTKAEQVATALLALGVPLQVLAATRNDLYRKPSTGAWDFYVDKLNGGLIPDLTQCLFVGDAAGRVEGWRSGRKKDFSCSDRKVAHNIGMPFKTPEEFYFGEKATNQWSWEKGGPIAANPFALAAAGGSRGSSASTTTGGGTDGALFNTDELAEGRSVTSQELDEGDNSIAAPQGVKQELVLFVGFPGCGKSTFAKRHFISKGYVHVNRDTLNTQAKCLKVTREALAEGKSVVIDNTSPGASVRAEYLKVAKSHNVSARCFRFKASKEFALHLNMYRERVTGGAHKHVPRIAFNMFNKNFQEPKVSEGFTKVLHVNFVPSFSSENEKKLFKMKM